MKRPVLTLAFFVSAALALVVAPALALAGPRSGASFGGRRGFRSPISSYSRSPSTQRGTYGRGPSVFILPGFGWGWGGMGGGMGLLGTLMMLGVVGLGTVVVVRAMRRAHTAHSDGDWDDEAAAMPDRAYVYKIQLGLGRSARGLQERLARFAAEGDTASDAGLASLLQQTVLELMRERHSVRWGAVEASGPMSLTNGETKMNAGALAERSRFQVERVRGADGKVRRSDIESAESHDALEYLVVTLLVATRASLPGIGPLTDHEALEALLSELGGVAPQVLLGLEVVWTPADPRDSLTETDLITTYPHLRSF